MDQKIPVLFVYGLLGLTLAFAPLLFSSLATGNPSSERQASLGRYPNVFGLLALGLTVSLMFYTGILLPDAFVLTAIGISFYAASRYRENPRDALAVFVAVLFTCTVSATLPWWRRTQPGMQISVVELIAFSSLLVVGARIFLALPSARLTSRSEQAVTFSLYALVSGYFAFSVATLEDPNAFFTLWHHWGAYIGPAELVREGARLFHDMPAQYGAGPTLLIALFCGSDCWSATYWIVAITTVSYSIIAGAIAWRMRSGQRYSDILILAICVLACSFWISYPPAASAPGITPSTSGLRFLFAMMMAAWIIFSEKHSLKSVARIGHMIWAVGFLWSPESAFYVTAIWWPIYLFDRVKKGPGTNRGVAIGTTMITLSVFLTLLLLIVLMGYRYHYGVFPVARHVLAYALYPPGPLPINAHGTIWFVALTVILSVFVSWRRYVQTSDVAPLRRSLTLQLLLFSTFSYYLGRSHDNNLLNLMPAILLVLLDALRGARDAATRQSAAFALASILAWTPLFGFDTWKNAFKGRHLADFDFSVTRAKFDYRNATTAANMAKRVNVPSTAQFEQTSKLMDQISKRGESFTVLDSFLDLQPNFPSKAWSAVHGPANFTYIPSALRREFLVETAQSLKRAGWLIVERDFDSSSWLADYDAVYERTERIEMEKCFAVRYQSRTSSGKTSAPNTKAP